MYGGPGGGRPGGGGMQEPSWLGTAFFAAIILSFIPGPWQIILSPILSLINLFYMFKFGIFILGIAAVFGIQWWFDYTTCEGVCPRCSIPQRAPKGEPFNCLQCGIDLEVEGEQFIPYMKSGKAPSSNPFDTLKDFAAEAQAAAAKQKPKSPAAAPVSSSPGRGPPKKPVEIIDAEVL